jgi:predicted metalloprotease with PDZ domain
VFEEAVGLSLTDIFDKQIRGTQDPELPAELVHVGLELRASADPGQTADGAHPLWLGVTTSGTKVTGVFDGSPAQAANLSPGDELVAIDRFRVTTDGELRSLIAARRPGDAVSIALFRRARLVEVSATLAAAPPTRFEIAGVADAGPAAARYQAWLGEPHPGSQILATVTTTARWV